MITRGYPLVVRTPSAIQHQPLMMLAYLVKCRAPRLPSHGTTLGLLENLVPVITLAATTVPILQADNLTATMVLKVGIPVAKEHDMVW